MCFPIPPCKCVPPTSPFWNLIRHQGPFNVQRWAQINFLHLYSHGKSFIGMNVLQSQERGKLMKNKYHETHCALLKQPSGFPRFNSGTEAVGTLPLIPRHSGCLNSINTQCYWGQKGIHYFRTQHSIIWCALLYYTAVYGFVLFCFCFCRFQGHGQYRGKELSWQGHGVSYSFFSKKKKEQTVNKCKKVCHLGEAIKP